jgi:hypothetical protein
MKAEKPSFSNKAGFWDLKAEKPSFLKSCTSIKNRVACQAYRLESLMYRLETRFFAES